MTSDQEDRAASLKAISEEGTRLLAKLDAMGLLLEASHLSMAIDLVELELARTRGSITIGIAGITSH